MLLLSAVPAAEFDISPTLGGRPHPVSALEFPAFVLDEEDFGLPGWRHAGSVWWWEAGCEAGGGAPFAPYGQTTPIIHGLPARMALVTLDGHPLVTDCMRGGANLDVVPLSFLGSIEVAKFPYGGYWVPGAASGAVALNTIRPGTSERKIQTFAGTLGSFASSVLFSGEKYLLAGTLYSIDGTDEDERLARRSVLGKYVIAPGLTAHVFHTEADHESSLDRLALGGVRWEWTSGGGTTLVAGASSSRFERTFDLFPGPGRVRDDLTRATVAVAPSPWRAHGLFCGLDLAVEELDQFAVDDESDASFGMFVRDEWSRTVNSSIVWGLRYDRSGQERDLFSPMLGFVWRRRDTSLRTSASFVQRPPSLQELHQGELDMGGYWLEGNSALEPEGVAGAEIECRFPVARWKGGRAEARLLGFYNWVTDVIEPEDTGDVRGGDGEPLLRFVNFDSAHTDGVEFETRLTSASWWAGVSYTWTEAENDETGARLGYHPANSVKAGMGYSRGGLKVELRAQFLSDRKATVVTGGTVETVSLDDCNLIDLYVGYKKDKAEYFLGVENLGDEKYDRAEGGITEATRGAVVVGGLRVRF